MEAILYFTKQERLIVKVNAFCSNSWTFFPDFCVVFRAFHIYRHMTCLQLLFKNAISTLGGIWKNWGSESPNIRHLECEKSTFHLWLLTEFWALSTGLHCLWFLHHKTTSSPWMKKDQLTIHQASHGEPPSTNTNIVERWKQATIPQFHLRSFHQVK